jgi:hypothetical protein
VSIDGPQPRPDLEPGILIPGFRRPGRQSRLGRPPKPGRLRALAKSKFVADPETQKQLEQVLKGKVLKKVKRVARRSPTGQVLIGIEVLKEILKGEREAGGPTEAILGEILVAIDDLLSDLEPLMPGSGKKQQIEIPVKGFEPKRKPPPFKPKIIPPVRRRERVPARPRRTPVEPPFKQPPATPPIRVPIPPEVQPFEPLPPQVEPLPPQAPPTAPPPTVAEPTEIAPSETAPFRRGPLPRQEEADTGTTKTDESVPSLGEIQQVALPTGIQTQRQQQIGTTRTPTKTATRVGTIDVLPFFLPFGTGTSTGIRTRTTIRDDDVVKERERQRERERIIERRIQRERGTRVSDNPVLDLIDQTNIVRQQQTTRTRQRECQEVKRRRRRKGKCREGFFREFKGKTRFITWRETDCLTGKETSLSKLKRKVGV